MPTTEELAERLDQVERRLTRKIDRLESRLSAVEQRLQEETLRPVRALAEADNEWPDSFNGFRRMMDREGVPARTQGGQIKRDSSTQTVFVSMYDLEEKC
ncbi:hypothetical protein [Salinibacter ruber]|uniref:hypothetical protein n=1 Tax=Salinibacter ruber TaxID=146919 RepID=UPI000E590838|nr:hypothetical protein [Salinibacter ruber]